ncbi:hypothetical protein BDN72DRAFT_665030 [Pluteus cervinus]|uniref:Uncharacterized protein n=1 Tax=Pluteus cervinus TaxID=181527 RepID=A0ACD3B950_9AGAR|nr:hypothetical protein BDN72DRAFT_665030 [Pluteus cervinus]
MTSDAPTKHHFFVFAPDKTEEGTFERRLSVRATHIKAAGHNVERGFIRVGGYLLTPESIATSDAPKKMAGSTFICLADNIEEVREIVENDIYYTSGVWDPERIVILPFVPATTLP